MQSHVFYHRNTPIYFQAAYKPKRVALLRHGKIMIVIRRDNIIELHRPHENYCKKYPYAYNYIDSIILEDNIYVLGSDDEKIVMMLFKYDTFARDGNYRYDNSNITDYRYESYCGLFQTSPIKFSVMFSKVTGEEICVKKIDFKYGDTQYVETSMSMPNIDQVFLVPDCPKPVYVNKNHDIQFLQWDSNGDIALCKSGCPYEDYTFEKESTVFRLSGKIGSLCI